nr:NADH dehydrogenase subunit 5 [Paradiplozoon hemiculteri]
MIYILLFLVLTFLVFGLVDFEFSLDLDFVTGLFYSDYRLSGSLLISREIFFLLYMLICCLFLCQFYADWYFGESLDLILLRFLLFIFVSIVFFLFISGGVLLSLIFWEYLGAVSFFLILFYGNGYCLSSGLVTLIFSRLGDVAFFVIFGFILNLDCYILGLIFLFGLVSGSKSAVFPLVSWLLEAMRAPTPVSALVHSSTLVAGGYWFLLQYSWLIFGSDFFLYFSLFCLFSILVCSLGSFLLNDLKKIVALSTSINLCWCFVFLLNGDVLLSVFQLVCHGLSKCFLFCLVGDSIRCNLGGQDYIGVNSWFGGGSCLFYYVWNLMGLSGFFFVGSFFGKHGFLSIFELSVINILFYFFVYVCFFFSLLYHLRSIFLYLGVWGYSCFSYFPFSNYFILVFVYFFILFSYGEGYFLDWFVELVDYTNFGLSLLFLFGTFLFFWFGYDVGELFLGFICFNYFVFDGWYSLFVSFYNGLKYYLDVFLFCLDRFLLGALYCFIFGFWFFGAFGLIFFV